MSPARIPCGRSFIEQSDQSCEFAPALRDSVIAKLLDVPVNTFRMWDSGLRPVPAPIFVRARTVVMHHARQTELLPLSQLA
jgi:hypothetical protein